MQEVQVREKVFVVQNIDVLEKMLSSIWKIALQGGVNLKEKKR